MVSMQCNALASAFASMRVVLLGRSTCHATGGPLSKHVQEGFLRPGFDFGERGQTPLDVVRQCVPASTPHLYTCICNYICIYMYVYIYIYIYICVYIFMVRQRIPVLFFVFFIALEPRVE